MGRDRRKGLVRLATSGLNQKRFELRLPDLGEGIQEAELVSWRVEVGDRVEEDQVVAEVETDKAIAEIPSPVSGRVVERLVEEGDVVPVGAVLIAFEIEGDAAAPATAPPGPQLAASGRELSPSGRELDEPPSPGPALAELPASERQLPEFPAAAPGSEEPSPVGPRLPVANPASPERLAAPEPPADPGRAASGDQPGPGAGALPYVRRLARDLGVELGSVRGSGPEGRVTQPDVLRTAEARGVVPDRVPLRGIRRATALNMARSFYTAPHAAVMDEVEVSELVDLRELLKPQAQALGVRLTYLPFIVMATVKALQAHPYLNSSLDDENQEIVIHNEFNIGIATDTPAGLLVPVIKAADRFDLFGLAREIDRLAGSAREQRLEYQEMQGGTFTISNVGPLGGVWSVPIIRHPEVAILAVHRIEKRPIVRADQVVVGQVLNLVLTFDHRVVDGADALRFLQDLTRYLEHPALLFVGTGS